jgi:hypothetical protein
MGIPFGGRFGRWLTALCTTNVSTEKDEGMRFVHCVSVYTKRSVGPRRVRVPDPIPGI